MGHLRPKILSISPDLTLLATRNRVLELAGFEVVGRARFGNSIETFGSEGFDLVILGDSIPSRERLQCLLKIKSRVPRLPVIVMHEPGEGGEDMVHADAVCGSLDGPEYLIHLAFKLVRFGVEREGIAKSRAASAS